jgi:hypothetical protein
MHAEGKPPVRIGRRRHRHYYPRHDLGPQALEPVEVAWEIGHTRSGGARHALDRAEEAAHDPRARVLQERVGLLQEPRVEDDVLEIGAHAERIQEPGRLPGGEAARERVARAYERRRVCELEALRLRHTVRQRSVMAPA